MERKRVYGESTTALTLELYDKEQTKIWKFLEESEVWIEIYIGMHKHINDQFMIDTNAGATIFKKDSETNQFYTGLDGWYALINTVEGLQEFMKVEEL